MRQQRTPNGAWLLVALAALTVAVAAAFAGVGYCSSATKGRAAAGAGAGGRVGGAAGGSSIGGGRVAVAPPSSAAAAAPLTSCLTAAADSSRSSSSSGDGRGRGAASRREAWQEGARTVGLWSLALGLAPAVARAADAAPADAAAVGPRRWISGKGEKPKGSKDRTGTKRDSSYLRCLSDCATDCRKPGQGLSRDSEDCLELCQDYCCQTYEQCTYLLQPE